jgi:hypothetical protein
MLPIAFSNGSTPLLRNSQIAPGWGAAAKTLLIPGTGSGLSAPT